MTAAEVRPPALSLRDQLRDALDDHDLPAALADAIADGLTPIVAELVDTAAAGGPRPRRDDIAHGASRYRYGCRCETCKRAVADYRNRYRAGKKRGAA